MAETSRLCFLDQNVVHIVSCLWRLSRNTIQPPESLLCSIYCNNIFWYIILMDPYWNCCCIKTGLPLCVADEWNQRGEFHKVLPWISLVDRRTDGRTESLFWAHSVTAVTTSKSHDGMTRKELLSWKRSKETLDGGNVSLNLYHLFVVDSQTLLTLSLHFWFGY